jgi:hypothetical protein
VPASRNVGASLTDGRCHGLLPVLQGMYCLTLEFESKMEFQQWEDRLPKIQSFFGPGARSKRPTGQTWVWPLMKLFANCISCAIDHPGLPGHSADMGC